MFCSCNACMHARTSPFVPTTSAAASRAAGPPPRLHAPPCSRHRISRTGHPSRSGTPRESAAVRGAIVPPFTSVSSPSLQLRASSAASATPRLRRSEHRSLA